MMQPSPTTSPATGENLWQATKKFWTLNTWFDLGFHLLLLVYYLQGQITATQVFLFYIMESMLIGAINFLRLVVAGYMKGSKETVLVNGIEKQWSGWYIAFFFLLHYGIFIMVQLIIFNAVSEFSTAWINPVRLLSDLLNHLGTQGRMLLLINFGIMLIGTATQFVKESEYKTKGLIAMMMEPYQRIFVQQFVLILGAFLIKNNWGLAFMLLFMVARFAFGGVFVQVMEKLKQPKPSIKTP